MLSFGQSNSIEFDHYSTDDGLSNSYVTSILQDSRGFMWFGTGNGLNRFDGISFKTYAFDPNDSTSIPGTWITSLNEDSRGNIWITTASGLCRFNREKDSFIRKNIAVDGEVIKDTYLITSFIDRSDFLWISSEHGAYGVDISTNESQASRVLGAKRFRVTEDDVSEINKSKIFSFVEDQFGVIWAASNSKNLFRFDQQQGQFIAHPMDHPEADRFSNNRKNMLESSDGVFFISIERNGLMEWNRATGQYTLHKPGKPETGPRGDVLFAIEEDANGDIWVGDRNAEGVSIFRKKTRTFSYCQSQELDSYSLNTNKINAIYRGQAGTMWVGTITGIDKHSPGKQKFKRYYSSPVLPDRLSFNNVLCFSESKTGDIWIGTDGGGLNKLNYETGKFSWYKHDPDDPESLSSNSIISVFEDHEGVVWMGTFHGGLARFEDGKFSAFLPDPDDPYAISNRNIWYVFEDSQRNLWLATLDSGIELFDRKMNRFYHYSRDEGDPSSLANNSPLQIFEDSRQKLYIVGNRGVSILDLKEQDFSEKPPRLKFKNLSFSETENSLSSNDIVCVQEDNKGNLWFGTAGSGIDKLDLTTGRFTNYSTENGLPGNSVGAILVDSLNNLWLATSKGLARFNPETEAVDVFTKADGLQSNNLKGKAIKTSWGEMFFGGATGFNSFYPEQIRHRNQHVPPVVITRLRIYNEPVGIDEQINGKVILSSDISETDELVLSYKENYFTLEFAALDYTTPAKNSFAYVMEGVDKGWVEAGTRRAANYTNLDPGEYVFRLKAANSDGVWNEQGVMLKVIITPPWWGTWLFRLAVAMLIIFLFTYLYFLRVRRFKRQQLLLEKLVSEKTAELQQMNARLREQAKSLNQTNAVLEERQAQIREQQRELTGQKDSLVQMNKELQNLNATKDKFFSIIAHDIKNPFSAILGLAEMLKANYEELDEEARLEIVDMINTSSQSVYQLLDNLLKWSRSQRGVIEFNPENIELHGAIADVIALMNGSAETKKIEFEVQVPKGLSVGADMQMLDVILRNLISNALKFTNTGGRVQVQAEASGEFVQINVSDNGVGMSPEVKEKLFEIDSNHTLRGTANEEGSGLGLILVKEFVSRHGGDIWVVSEPGKGSSFYFTLPATNPSGTFSGN